MLLFPLVFASAALASAAPAPKVCAVGDWGSGYPRETAVAEAMARFGCTDVLFLGDNFYPEGVESVADPQWRTKFETPFSKLRAAGARFHVILGNHDHKGSIQAQMDYGKTHPQWLMPSDHYRFRIADVCYFAIDSDKFAPDQGQWVASELKDKDCPWRVVLGHHPALDRRAHAKESQRLKAVERIEKIRAAIKGADVYLSGHDHGFADEGDQGGFRQLIAGTGGANLKSLVCVSAQCKYAEGAYGFLHLFSDGSGLHWEFYNTALERRYRGDLAAK